MLVRWGRSDALASHVVVRIGETRMVGASSSGGMSTPVVSPQGARQAVALECLRVLSPVPEHPSHGYSVSSASHFIQVPSQRGLS